MRAYSESAGPSASGFFAAEDVVFAILSEIAAVVVIPIQWAIYLPVGIGGRGSGVLVLALMHDLQVHPVPVLAFVVLLHAACDIARFRIMPALGLAGLVILDRQFQPTRMVMPGKGGAARKQNSRQQQKNQFHGISSWVVELSD
jgi:hypothetical protein